VQRADTTSNSDREGTVEGDASLCEAAASDPHSAPN